MPISNIKALIKQIEWRNANPTFELEPEIVEWAKLHADFFLERWQEGNQTHWKGNEKRNNFIGLLGQKCFELTLQDLEIPYVPNDPVIDWRTKKNYDFRVPYVGKIEVKTVDCKTNQERLIIKCTEWHSSDYIFAVKLENEKPTKIRYMGYAEKKQVTEQFNHAVNEFPCLYDPCYWTYLNKLQSATDFFDMLMEKTALCWNEQNDKKEN